MPLEPVAALVAAGGRAADSSAAFDLVGPKLADVAENLFRLGDAPGQGSRFQSITQLLAGSLADWAMAEAAGGPMPCTTAAPSALAAAQQRQGKAAVSARQEALMGGLALKSCNYCGGDLSTRALALLGRP